LSIIGAYKSVSFILSHASLLTLSKSNERIYCPTKCCQIVPYEVLSHVQMMLICWIVHHSSLTKQEPLQ